MDYCIRISICYHSTFSRVVFCVFFVVTIVAVVLVLHSFVQKVRILSSHPCPRSSDSLLLLLHLRRAKHLIMIGFTLSFILFFLHTTLSSTLARSRFQNENVYRRQASTNTSGLLEDFQVYKPVSVPSASCELVLMEYDFANSYGVPFVGNYTPPACDFNSVVINITVTSAGVQYDRLAMMYLGSIEVWRTSTAEPTSTGIIWSYTKDMSQYLSLWKSPQTIIFDLDNIVDSTYTGIYNTTLTATFFHQPDAPVKADLILPISAELGSEGEASVFSVPSENATVDQTIPSNSIRASVSIAACGQIDEEFWYTNVLNSDVNTFEDTTGTLYGYSPFREIQLWIDGLLAGVAWPFPVIFTGGIAPGFWQPIVGIDAFDLREYEIDITPFLPYLMDGGNHSFTIKVVGVNDNNGEGPATLADEAGSYWLVTGKIFLFYGNNTANVSHTAPTISAPTPDIYVTSSVGQSSNGTNETLAYSVTASRSFSVSSSFGTWTQSLSYSNEGLLTSEGLVQVNTQSTTGSVSSIDLSYTTFRNDVSFSYPITVNTSYGILSDDALTIDAEIDRGLSITASGRPDISVYTLVAGPSTLNTTQFGTAEYSDQTNSSYSFGDTTQDFREESYGSLYTRDVHAINSSVVSDSLGESSNGGYYLTNIVGAAAVRPITGGTRAGVRAFIGRGPE